MAGARSVALGLISAVIAVAGPGAGAALAAPAAPKLYWGNLGNGTMGEANLAGGGVNQAFMTGFGGGGGEPFGLAVDGQHIYYADLAAGTIGVANFDGTIVNGSLISGIRGVTGVAVNSRNIYWTDSLTNTVGEANLDDSDRNLTLITDAHFPAGIAVDGDHIYWSNNSQDTISEANLDGTGEKTLVTDAAGPVGVAADGQHVYWTNNDNGTIGEANLDGTDDNESFVTGGNNVEGVAVQGQYIYWSNGSANGTIGVASLDGTGANQNFITGANDALPVAVSVPVAEVSPASPPPFASTAPGSLSAPTTVTVTNGGQQQTLSFTGLSLTGANTGDFVIGADSCIGGVDPGGSCQLQVYFTPQAAGARSATLQITTNDYANGPTAVPLSGTGASAPAAPIGPTGSTGSATQGSQPPGKVELLSCASVSKTVTKKVKGKARKVQVRQQRCSGKLVVGIVDLATGGGVNRATLARGRVRYATGTDVQLSGGRSQLALTNLRPLRRGRYTLRTRGRSTTITLG